MRIEKRLRPFVNPHKYTQQNVFTQHTINDEEPILKCRTLNVEEDFLEYKQIFLKLIRLRCVVRGESTFPPTARFTKDTLVCDPVILDTGHSTLISKAHLFFEGEGAYLSDHTWVDFQGKNVTHNLALSMPEKSIYTHNFPMPEGEYVEVTAHKQMGGYFMEPSSGLNVIPIFKAGCMTPKDPILSDFAPHFMTVRYKGNGTTIQSYSLKKILELGLSPSSKEVQKCKEFGECKVMKGSAMTLEDALLTGEVKITLLNEKKTAHIFASYDVQQKGHTNFMDVLFKKMG